MIRKRIKVSKALKWLNDPKNPCLLECYGPNNNSNPFTIAPKNLIAKKIYFYYSHRSL